MKLPAGRSRVFLIGFMGSGKSAVGKALAERLALPFVDTDARIERRAGLPVAEIFRRQGEGRFRAMEARAIAGACRAKEAVVAAGGGAVLLAQNVARMRRAGTVVWLRATKERLWSRIRRDGLAARPVLAAAGPRPKRALALLLAARSPLYRRAAHFAVSSAGAPAAVAERIARELRWGAW